MLNEPTRKRLLAICTKLSKKQKVSDFDLSWAQKNAIHDEEAESLLKKVDLFIPAKDQEDTTEV
jgi:hypothetical protein